MPETGAQARAGDPGSIKKPVRVWCDGCYDMMHFGHANSLRQAKQFGDYLIVGVHSDEDIRRHKGPPVMPEQARYDAVRACKWVDEVVEGSPYVTTLEILDQYKADFCVHGDDITTDEHGNDTYSIVKKEGRYRECKRTPGVSTTDLVSRMLGREKVDAGEPPAVISPYQRASDDFLLSSRMIAEFAAGNKPPGPDTKVVYMPGMFDMFHNGHIAAMREARALGDYLICGLHTDDDVTDYDGHPPLVTLRERVLAVLQCRYADEVIVGAPVRITADLLDQFKVSVVVHGKTPIIEEAVGFHPYEEPMRRGIFQRIESKSDVSAKSIITAILADKARFQERNRKKSEKEIKVIAAQHAREKAAAEGAAATAAK